VVVSVRQRRPQERPCPGSDPISTIEAAPTTSAPVLDLEAMARDAEQAASPAALQGFARGLGLTFESLRRLRVGWLESHRAWSFPMTDAAGAVLGIRLRSGKAKFAVTGGHDGLFLPETCPTWTSDGARLVICEGPTDTAALLDLGFSARGARVVRAGLPYLSNWSTSGGRRKSRFLRTATPQDCAARKPSRLLWRPTWQRFASRRPRRTSKTRANGSGAGRRLRTWQR
jgi:hypothetical protein